jgi:transposase
MEQTIIPVGGIDIGKAFLDLAVVPEGRHVRVGNDAAGWSAALAWFRAAGVELVGLEASGGYERGVLETFERGALAVVLHQPVQVRLYARMTLRRAKNDRLDARLIAAFTALAPNDRPAPDGRLRALADHLVFIEQLAEDTVRLKTRLEQCRDARIAQLIRADIATLRLRQRRERARLEAAIRADPGLSRRLDLLLSIPGIGLPTAMALLIDMPELGQLSREQAAALIGLAPFDHDSGMHKGQRHIAGGRARPRKALYAAALPAAFKWNPALQSLYKRLIARGKAHKQALVACARKLITYANTVLARGTPWTTQTNGCSW